MWHVAQWVSHAPPRYTLPAFLNLNGKRTIRPKNSKKSVVFCMYHNRVYIVFFHSLIKFTIICEFLFTTFRKIWVANLFNCQDEKSLWLAKILVIFSEEKSVNWLSLVSLTFEPPKFILPIVLIYSEIIILNEIYFINIIYYSDIWRREIRYYNGLKLISLCFKDLTVLFR